MKERIQKFWKRSGFSTVFMSALVIVLAMSGIAGYRSGHKEKGTVRNAAEFAEANQDIVDGSLTSSTHSEENMEAQSVNVDVAETFGDETKIIRPTEGEVLKPFSMDTTIYYETLDQYKCNPAMLIEADVNQEVVASYGGTVQSIVEDRENGTMITVDMGNGYRAIYGQMKDVGVKEGDVIVKGQALGNVAEVTSYFSEEGSHLYFALTKDDVPVNPKDYLEN